MELTINGIIREIATSNKDTIFLLTNETAEEIVDILIDDGVEFGSEECKQTEASIMKILDEEEVIMLSTICGEIYLESAYGYTDLKEHEQDDEWHLFVEEELVLDELVDLDNVYDRLGDAENINVFGLYLTEPDYSNDDFEDMEECTCCECCDKCDEEFEEECDSVVEYLEEITEEALEDILMMEYKCPECLNRIIGELSEEAFKVGFEAGLKSIKDSIGEYLGE